MPKLYQIIIRIPDTDQTMSEICHCVSKSSIKRDAKQYTLSLSRDISSVVVLI